MLTRTSAIILGLLAVLTIAPAASLTRVIRIDVPNHDAVYSLGRELRLDIVDARATFINAYADDAQIAAIRARGFPVTVLFDDFRSPEAGVFVLHHSYAQACSILVAATTAYPGITHLDTIGYSYNNHAIPAIKITSNPTVPADKPVVRILGVHHGTETQGAEICLSLVQFLTSGYGVNRYFGDTLFNSVRQGRVGLTVRGISGTHYLTLNPTMPGGVHRQGIGWQLTAHS